MNVDVLQQGRALCPYPAGAGKGAVGWAAAGPAVLADCHSDPVPLVPERLGRTGKAVRSGLLCGGRSPLFWDNQPLAAASGLPGSRSDGRTFGHFDLSAGGGEGNSKKNQKNCKKCLPFRNEMVYNRSHDRAVGYCRPTPCPSGERRERP